MDDRFRTNMTVHYGYEPGSLEVRVWSPETGRYELAEVESVDPETGEFTLVEAPPAELPPQ